MAAIHGVLAPFLHAGAHVVAPSGCYGTTQALLIQHFGRYGVETTFVDGADVEAVSSAMREQTGVVYAETLANPTMAVADLPALARVAHQADPLLVVDSTFASPVVCRPLEPGIDPGAVRFSIGLEDPDDLVADILAALDSLH